VTLIATLCALRRNAGCTEVEHGTYATQETWTRWRSTGRFFDPQESGLVIHNYLDIQAEVHRRGHLTEDGFAKMQEVLPGDCGDVQACSGNKELENRFLAPTR